MLQELDEGKVKVEEVQMAAKVVLPESAEKGQTLIKNEMQTLGQNLAALTEECTERKIAHTQSVQTLQSYDNNCERLSQWVKDMKAALSNPELMSSLKEKQMQASHFQVKYFLLFFSKQLMFSIL